MTVETLDLIHSYLTEKRVLGVSRYVSGGKPKLRVTHSNDPKVPLATINTSGTKAMLESVYLKRLSATSSGVATIDLTDPQGLEQLEKVLREVANTFNTFYKQLMLYRTSIDGFVEFPSNMCGEHAFSQ